MLQIHNIEMNRTKRLVQNLVNYLDALIQEKIRKHAEYDLINDIGIYPRTNDEELMVKRSKDADFRKLVQSLNVEQKEFFYCVLNSVKTDKLPLRLFLSRGAGVGKSTVTNALYEDLIRYLISDCMVNYIILYKKFGETCVGK